MYTSVSGQLAVFKQMEIIANNLANLSTVGFKAERPLFERALDKQSSMLTGSLNKDIIAPNTLKTEEFVGIRGSFSDLSQGPLETTGRPLDVAIDGKGFFVVQTQDGERYTRAGNFQLDAQGRLVTPNGDPVMGQGGEINIKGQNVSISDDGSITVDKQVAGKLRIATLTEGSMTREAKLLFQPAEGATLTDNPNPKLVPGSVESSNVNAVRELAEMIIASRLYEGFRTAQDSESKIGQERNQAMGSLAG